jgi:PAP2 superfamily protein
MKPGDDLDVLLWGLIAATIVAAALAVGIAGLSFDWTSVALPAVACIALGAIAWFYRYRRPDERIVACLIAVAQIVAFSAAGAVLSYALATANRPLWDDALLSWDGALGFDWRAYVGFVAARPWLHAVLTAAYATLIAQMVVAVAVLGLSGRIVEAKICNAAVVISALVTIVVSPLVPAMPMFLHADVAPHDYPKFLVHLMALRDGTMETVSLADVDGIISFPSYHTALALILTASVWKLRWLRWPFVVLNALLIAATPIHGGHYFVDLIAGAAVAVLAMAASHPLARASGRPLRSLLKLSRRRGRVGVASLSR